MAKEYAGKQMRDLVEAAGPETVGPEEAGPVETGPVRRSPAPVLVGAADDRAEVEADAVASRVMARLAAVPAVPHSHAPGCGHDLPVQRSYGGGRPAVGAAGGALPADAEADLTASRGGGSPLDSGVRRRMETGFGRSLPADVRVHTDQRANRLAGQMGAVAFTHGSDIHFAAGAYAPDTDAGQQLLAHELTHVVQQRGGVPATRRKLGGTAAALRSQGAEDGKAKSSGFLRKVTRQLTNWDKLLDAVRDYEAAEAKALSGGINKLSAGPHKPTLLARLAAVQRYIAKWREANDDEQQTKELNEKVAKDGGQDKDTRTKANRRQAIAMLVPRVNDEERMLGKDDIDEWLRSAGVGGATVTGTGGSERGGVNEVHKVAKQRLVGNEEGFFKAEHGMTERSTYQGHEQETGIRQVDPNAGARSLALYRLDQLFGAGVTAKVEFAVYDNGGGARMGTFMEKAKGTSGSDTTWARTKEGAQQTGPGAVALDDPALQRGLNVLQLLDAISGQLDRHSGNFFVDTDDKGNVTKVTGIDLDMSFGEKMTTTGREGAEWEGRGKNRKLVKEGDTASSAHNYRGLPEYIDEAFGLRLLQVRPIDIQNALKGLLTDTEIAATLARFAQVQAAVQKAKDDGTLVKEWNGETAGRGRLAGSKLGWNSEHKSYRDNLEAALKAQRSEALAGKFLKVLRHPNLARMAPALAGSPDLLQVAEKVFTHEGGVAVLGPIAKWLHDHQVSPREEDQLVFRAAKEAFADSALAPFAKQAAEGKQVSRGDLANAISGQVGKTLAWFEHWLELDRLEKSL